MQHSVMQYVLHLQGIVLHQGLFSSDFRAETQLDKLISVIIFDGFSMQLMKAYELIPLHICWISTLLGNLTTILLPLRIMSPASIPDN